MLQKIRTRKRGGEGSGAASHFGALTFSSTSSDDSSPLSAAELHHLATLLQRLSHTGEGPLYYYYYYY